ncbi:hypothetical protein H6F87_02280 [Cyanobacteria bacterium FACHB-502]|nr:hypothetical protein [Cyanobacteria bacterium FACHB-502]
MATIRKHRPGLVNDSALVTSALVEYALALESGKARQTNYQTPYGMTIIRTSQVPSATGIFQFLIRSFDRIAAIFAHIDDEEDEFQDYISRGNNPAYTFVLKGKGFTDFEFIHIATDGTTLFEECLALLVLDFKHHRNDIRFNVICANQPENRWEGRNPSNYVPSLDEMAKVFFQDETYLFSGGGGQTSSTLDWGWQANSTPYQGFPMDDTRFVDYSHALVGLKPSSFGKEKYGVEGLTRSGVLAVERDYLDRRYRCLCNGWTREKQNLDLYELGHIFGEHFGNKASFSPARLLQEITMTPSLNATVYAEGGKRIEILPMNWNESWFTYRIDGKGGNQGWSTLWGDPNPFRLYDMNDFFPNDLERYKQQKKKPN